MCALGCFCQPHPPARIALTCAVTFQAEKDAKERARNMAREKAAQLAAEKEREAAEKAAAAAAAAGVPLVPALLRLAGWLAHVPAAFTRRMWS